MKNYKLFKTIINHLNRDGGQAIWSQSMVFLCASNFDLETCRIIAKKLFGKYPEFARKMADNFGYEPIEFLSNEPLSKKVPSDTLDRTFTPKGYIYHHDGVPYTGNAYTVKDDTFESNLFVSEKDLFGFINEDNDAISYVFANGRMFSQTFLVAPKEIRKIALGFEKGLYYQNGKLFTGTAYKPNGGPNASYLFPDREDALTHAHVAIVIPYEIVNGVLIPNNINCYV